MAERLAIGKQNVKQWIQGWIVYRLCRLVPHTSTNGLPLPAQQNERMSKAALLDVGIAHALWNTPAIGQFPQW